MAEEATQQAVAAASRQAELADALSQHLCKVLESTMAEAVQALAIQVVVLAVHKAKQLKDIAEAVKHDMDQKAPPDEGKDEGVFHCVAGKSFASAISHGARQYMHLKVDTFHIILWRSK